MHDCAFEFFHYIDNVTIPKYTYFDHNVQIRVGREKILSSL